MIDITWDTNVKQPGVTTTHDIVLRSILVRYTKIKKNSDLESKKTPSVHLL